MAGHGNCSAPLSTRIDRLFIHLRARVLYISEIMLHGIRDFKEYIELDTLDFESCRGIQLNLNLSQD